MGSLRPRASLLVGVNKEHYITLCHFCHPLFSSQNALMLSRLAAEEALYQRPSIVTSTAKATPDSPD